MSLLLYSVDWKRLPRPPRRRQEGPKPNPLFSSRRVRPVDRAPQGREDLANATAIRVTCLDESGRLVHLVKLYEDWLGVCAEDVESVTREIEHYLPGVRLRRERVDPRRLHRRVLPYFAERLRRGRFDSEDSPFYRIFAENCPVEEIGLFLGRRHDIDYFRECDWHVRLYVDLCTRDLDPGGFFYRWYRVNDAETLLLDAFEAVSPGDPRGPTARLPRFALAAFDIETVAGPDSPPDRIPDGTDPEDRIVMISIVTWHAGDDTRAADEKVLYLNPLSFRSQNRLGRTSDRKESTQKTRLELGDRRFLEYHDERNLLNDFHYFVRDVRVLTGYNVDLFDVPCIFARLLFLGRFDLLSAYSSRKVGGRTVVTFDDKIVLDLYAYFRIFSNYDLSGFKLDQVAKTKLGREGLGKMELDAVGIHAWYHDLVPSVSAPPATRSEAADAALRLCRCTDPQTCHETLFGIWDSWRDSWSDSWRVLREAEGGGLPARRRRRPVPPERFGTFRQYVEYCLRDSQVVRDLFRKETVFDFLVERARFAAADVLQAMHWGNSRFLSEVFRAYAPVVLGFFVNAESFRNQSDSRKFAPSSGGSGGSAAARYQGALNFCIPESHFRDVVVMDFASMYPTTLLCSNLCYGTCDILTASEYARLDGSVARQLEAVPYRNHSSESDLPSGEERPLPGDACRVRVEGDEYAFRYPELDPKRDEFVIVRHRPSEDGEGPAFLPAFVRHFLALRKDRKREWARTGDVVHYNAQLCIKLLLNSLYGVMASKDSPLAYIVVAMSVVTLARYQLLGTFRFVQEVLRYTVCYADTDSLMVHRWPRDDCEVLNRFLRRSLPHVEIEFEERFRQLLVLSKKRYVYQRADGRIETKGFQKKINGLVRFMSDRFKETVMGLGGKSDDASRGWIAWVETLTEGLYMCRDPGKYAVTRKTRKLSDYKSTTCPAVKILARYPEKEGEYVDYTFGRADVAKEEEGKWVMAAEECKYVNFEKLFVNQKKTFCSLLNVGFWNSPDHAKACDAVLNGIRWRYFVHAELLHRAATGKKLIMLMEKGVKYTFGINDHPPFKRGGQDSEETVKRKGNVVPKTNAKNKKMKQGNDASEAPVE